MLDILIVIACFYFGGPILGIASIVLLVLIN